MAAVTHRVATADTGNVTSYVSGAFTPAAGDLLVAFTVASATVAAGTMTASANGITFTKVTSAVRGGSIDTLYAFVANQLVPASPASMTVTFDCTGDAATGVTTFVASVSGMNRVGLGAIRQSQKKDNQAAGSAPTFTFASTPVTSNPQLVVTGNAEIGSAALTPPSGFTERSDTGYATPDRGAEYATVDSGATAATVTWGSSSPTATGSVGLELETAQPVRREPEQMHWPRPMASAVTRSYTW